jgi:hypothetical protein
VISLKNEGIARVKKMATMKNTSVDSKKTLENIEKGMLSMVEKKLKNCLEYMIRQKFSDSRKCFASKKEKALRLRLMLDDDFEVSSKLIPLILRDLRKKYRPRLGYYKNMDDRYNASYWRKANGGEFIRELERNLCDSSLYGDYLDSYLEIELHKSTIASVDIFSDARKKIKSELRAVVLWAKNNFRRARKVFGESMDFYRHVIALEMKYGSREQGENYYLAKIIGAGDAKNFVLALADNLGAEDSYDKAFNVFLALVLAMNRLTKERLSTSPKKVKLKLEAMDSAIRLLKSGSYRNFFAAATGLLEERYRNYTDYFGRFGSNIDYMLSAAREKYLKILEKDLENNLKSEEEYQSYIKFENFRAIIYRIAIEGRATSRRIGEIAGELLLQRDYALPARKALVLASRSYGESIDQELRCKNLESANDYRLCLLRIKKLSRFVFLVTRALEGLDDDAGRRELLERCLKFEDKICSLALKKSREEDSRKSFQVAMESIIKLTAGTNFGHLIPWREMLDNLKKYHRDLLEYYRILGEQRAGQNSVAKSEASL